MDCEQENFFLLAIEQFKNLTSDQQEFLRVLSKEIGTSSPQIEIINGGQRGIELTILWDQLLVATITSEKDIGITSMFNNEHHYEYFESIPDSVEYLIRQYHLMNQYK